VFIAKDFLSSGPILLYLLIASVLIANGLTYYAAHKVRKERTSDTNTTVVAKEVREEGKHELPTPSDFPTPDWSKPLTPVIKKKYRNETVEIDGKAFHHCEFQDVTFVWNGTKQWLFIGCKMPGREEVGFSSRNPLVFGTLQLLASFKAAAGGKE